jgi:hypothetical protein
MFTASDLNYILIVYVDNFRVARIPCNFLLTSELKPREILKHFVTTIDNVPKYYTSFEIEHKGSTVYRESL